MTRVSIISSIVTEKPKVFRTKLMLTDAFLAKEKSNFKKLLTIIYIYIYQQLVKGLEFEYKK